MVGSTISAMPRTAKDRERVSPLCVDESLGNSSAATPRVDNGEEEEADLGFKQSPLVHFYLDDKDKRNFLVVVKYSRIL